MISGNSVGNITELSYLSILCYILGGILMGISMNDLYRADKRMKDERKDFEKQLACKTGQEKELSAVENVEKVLNGNQNVLLGLLRRQDEFYASYKNDIEQIVGVCGSFFDEIQKISKEQRDAVINVKNEVEKIGKLHLDNTGIQESITQLTEMKENVGQLHLDSLAVKEDMGQLHLDNLAMQKGIDQLHVDNGDVQESFNQLHLDNKEVQIAVDQFHIECAQMQKDTEEEILQIKTISNEVFKKLDMIDEKANQTKEASLAIDQNIEEVISEIKDIMEAVQEKLEYLQEDIQEQENDKKKKLNSIMKEIQGRNEGDNLEIDKISNQYEQFKNTINEMVDVMKGIAKEDVKVMGEFLKKC